MNDFYLTRWKCSNCEAGYPLEEEERIPKGMTIKRFFEQKECPRCGCKGTRYCYGGTFEDDPPR